MLLMLASSANMISIIGGPFKVVVVGSGGGAPERTDDHSTTLFSPCRRCQSQPLESSMAVMVQCGCTPS